MDDKFYTFLKKIQHCHDIKGCAIDDTELQVFSKLYEAKQVDFYLNSETDLLGRKNIVRYVSLTPLGQDYINNYEKDRQSINKISFRVGDNSIIQLQQGTTNSNQTIMRQNEKLDAILKYLYQKRFDGKHYPIDNIINELNIELVGNEEASELGKRLADDGLVDSIPISMGRILVALNTHGVDYCEGTSYSFKDISLINNNYNLTIANSPNSNIVNQSENISIKQEFGNINEIVEKIIDEIQKDKSVNEEKAREILDCLSEIQDNLKNNKKPKFAIKSLIDIAGGISSIASWITVLGQFAGIIPTV